MPSDEPQSSPRPTSKDGVDLPADAALDEIFPEDFGSELTQEDHDDVFNPFPPGYGNDLFEN